MLKDGITVIHSPVMALSNTGYWSLDTSLCLTYCTAPVMNASSLSPHEVSVMVAVMSIRIAVSSSKSQRTPGFESMDALLDKIGKGVVGSGWKGGREIDFKWSHLSSLLIFDLFFLWIILHL